MNEIKLVHRLQRRQQRQTAPADLVDRHPVLDLAQPIGERRQRNELHHQARPPVVQHRSVVQRRRVDAAQLVQRIAFQLQAHDGVGVGHRDLHGDLATVGSARGEQHLTEPAAPEHLLHHQPVDARHQRRRLHLRRLARGLRGLRRDLGPASRMRRLPPAAALGASGPNALHERQATIGRRREKMCSCAMFQHKKKRPVRASGPAF